MKENEYFIKALKNFVSDVAYVQSVRHLYDRGLTVEEIKERCGYPVSIQKIEKVIEDYEKEKNSPQSEYTFVQETNAYGRKSFRMVKKEG